jgi:cytochrome c oxidase subunit 2
MTPASPVADKIAAFQFELAVLTGAVFLLVAGFLLIAAYRFRARVHPVPSAVDHSPELETALTLMPILLLAVVAFLSWRLIAFEAAPPNADVSIFVTGFRDHWSYAYPEEGGFQFDSTVLPEAIAKERHRPRLAAVDNPLVVPVGQTVEVVATGAGVLTTWSVPALGAKVEAVPGRENSVWFTPTRTGTYYGQCAGLCGPDRAVLPVEVRVVSLNEYRLWLADTKKRYAGVPQSLAMTRLAMR